MVQQLCEGEEVGFVELWRKTECTWEIDGLHLSGKGAAVFADGLSGAVARGLCNIRYLN